MSISIGKDLYIKNRSKEYRFSINFFQKIKTDTIIYPSRLSIAVWDSSEFDEIAVWAIKENFIHYKTCNTRKRKIKELTVEEVCETAETSLRSYVNQKKMVLTFVKYNRQ